MLVGVRSGEPMSHDGRVIYHDNPRELHFLYEKSIALGSHVIKELPSKGLGRPLLRLKDHPDMQAVTWPLNPADFQRR